jgi:hypothetical protein
VAFCFGGKVKKKEKELDVNSLKKDENGKYILPLNKAIKIKDKTITEFHLDEPKAKHMRSMPTNPSMDDIMNVIGSLAGEPDHVIDELSVKDVNLCAEFFQAFA